MAEVTITKQIIDTNSNGAIDEDEWNAVKAQVKPGNTLVVTDGDRAVLTKTYAAMESLFSGDANAAQAMSSDANAPSQLTAEDRAKVQELQEKMDALFEKLQKATADDAKNIKADLAKAVNEALALKAKGGAFDSDRLAKYKELSGAGDSKKAMKAMVQSNSSSGGSGTANGTNTASGAKAQTMTSSYPPAGWSAQTTDSASFSSDAYLASLSTTDDIMASWDSISSNQSKGKQLMQLFYYFAKMAESGDMGAMYQFMKFVTYIISKDKAKQQIEMGKKLIELQDLSREWTNKLTGLSTSSDASSSNELMKTMTLVKSETDAIATSQKLVSQMMEEFAQVVETLTNTTKSALETNGRIQRTVSRFSA